MTVARPKVTVLLAVKDGEPYVRQAVESVLAQTYADFELLVVDDASSDRTIEIVESLGDERIRLLRNEQNLGQAPSLNRGLREARGEYVARLDADDWCRPERLERQAAVLDAQPQVGLVGTWLDAVDERGRRVARLRARLDDLVAFVYATLIMRVYISHPASMYRREPVLALGGYDEATAPSEDKDLWRRLLLERWDARIVPEPLVFYRLHDAQLSQTRAAYQRRVDELSQERFLDSLAPGAPVRGLRLLLAGDPDCWREDPAEALQTLELVLAGARERLRLDGADAGRLERLVALRLVHVAAARPWLRQARAVSSWSLRRLPIEERVRAAAVFAVAPVRDGLRRGSHALAHTPALDSLRPPARRLRLARRLYGKVLGDG